MCSRTGSNGLGPEGAKEQAVRVDVDQPIDALYLLFPLSSVNPLLAQTLIPTLIILRAFLFCYAVYILHTSRGH